MKFKTILIVLILSLFFVGEGVCAFESNDSPTIAYETSMEVSEQVEEVEYNQNFLPESLLSYLIINSNTIFYEPPFFLRNNLADIEKPPIIS